MSIGISGNLEGSKDLFRSYRLFTLSNILLCINRWSFPITKDNYIRRRSLTRTNSQQKRGEMYYLYKYCMFRAYLEETCFFQRIPKGHLRKVHTISSRFRQTIVLLDRRFNRTRLRCYNLSFEGKIQLKTRPNYLKHSNRTYYILQLLFHQIRVPL